MHRPLSEVVVDAKDRLLVEPTEQRAVQGLRRSEIAAEGLFDDDPSCLGGARERQLPHHQPEDRRRDGEIMRGPLRLTELLLNGAEGGWVLVVPVDVAQEARQLVECSGVESAVLLDAFSSAGAELVDSPAGL